MSAPAFGDAQQRQDAALAERDAWPERSPWIRTAVRDIPRSAFAPRRLWHWNGQAYLPLDRTKDVDRWAAEVYADPDAAAVTQLTGGLPTSSLSCTAVVVDMLDSLLLDTGHRVLELGTGTGWNAALLAHRAGNNQVVSVETDPGLAASAQRRLTGSGTAVQVVVGDGAVGFAPGAPYDRVISTYAVDTIPFAWVEQLRPGGRLVTPWGHLGHVALTVAEDGSSASGWMQGLAQFMPARTRLPAADTKDFSQVRGDKASGGERPFLHPLETLEGDWGLRFHLRVAMPEMRITTAQDQDGWNAWIHDGLHSWAVLAAQGDGKTITTQGGPRRLADLLDAAWEQWSALGSPPVYDYGMTVTNGGATQYVWANDPLTGPRWALGSAARQAV
ncbi:methyltransferase domain-containing protein [Streptomyces sp. NBC_00237]|uniref:methyltransferase domain-containing protein n=1 Tax=Streptomyces sp. NBC_00237 TaxID=2975687 RepID=UPI002253FC75|nr:methyltransferase domain-containing protein [Streptomyces sp. NBC_00237]MCX5206078.1 methyltransferase domain-containing protein [Streptomyces sp. NBC_00237]